MDQPLVSIIIPVYKVEKYLRRCLDSVRNQTYKNIEVIMVDDGSPDGCPQICDEYAAKDRRFHVIHKENGGVSSARNAGLDYCGKFSGGGYIGFVDSDDTIHKAYIQTLYDLASKYHASISACGIVSNKEIPDVKTNCECYISKMDSFRFDKWYAGFSSCGKIYSRRIFEKSKLRFAQDLTVAEDMDFFCRALLASENGYIATSEPLYYYDRSNSLSATHQFDCRYFEDWESFLERAKNQLADYPKIYKSIYVLSGCYLTYLKNFWECGIKNDDVQYRKALSTIRKKLPLILSSHAPMDVKAKLLFIACFPEFYKKIKYTRKRNV